MSEVPIAVAFSEAPVSPRDTASYIKSWGWHFSKIHRNVEYLGYHGIVITTHSQDCSMVGSFNVVEYASTVYNISFQSYLVLTLCLPHSFLSPSSLHSSRPMKGTFFYFGFPINEEVFWLHVTPYVHCIHKVGLA